MLPRLVKDTVWECWPLPLAYPHFPLDVELEDCGDHQVLEGRGPGSGHVRELALTNPLWVCEHGSHFHMTLSSFLIDHTRPQVTLCPGCFFIRESDEL